MLATTSNLQILCSLCIQDAYFSPEARSLQNCHKMMQAILRCREVIKHNQPIKFCYSVTFTTNVKCTRLNNKISLKLLPDKAIIHARHRLSSGLSKIPTHCTYKYRLYASVVIDNSISQNFDKCSCTLMKKFAQSSDNVSSCVYQLELYQVSGATVCLVSFITTHIISLSLPHFIS